MKQLALVLLLTVACRAQMNADQRGQQPCQPLILAQFPASLPPSEIKVNGERWKITLVNRPIVIEKIEYVGWTIDAQYAIDLLPPELQKKRRLKEILLVTKDQNPYELRTGLMHELMHAVIGTERSSENITVHRFIEIASQGVMRVLLENPELYRWMGMR